MFPYEIFLYFSFCFVFYFYLFISVFPNEMYSGKNFGGILEHSEKLYNKFINEIFQKSLKMLMLSNPWTFLASSYGISRILLWGTRGKTLKANLFVISGQNFRMNVPRILWKMFFLEFMKKSLENCQKQELSSSNFSCEIFWKNTLWIFGSILGEISGGSPEENAQFLESLNIFL